MAIILLTGQRVVDELRATGHALPTIGPRQVTVADLPLHVVSARTAEQADLVVCAPVSAAAGTPFTDNVFTMCADCATPIVHRPHAPAAPPKVCFDCARTRLEGRA